MGIADCGSSMVGGPTGLHVPTTRRPLQRLATVRRLQGLSRRTVARRLNVEVSQLKEQERATADMPLSRLYEWQKALEVPITELLVEPGDPLSPPVLERAQLVRAMKTVLAILDETRETPTRRMAETLAEQLTQMMPELKGVGSWHAVGHRRRRDELGIAAERCLSDDVFLDLTD